MHRGRVAALFLSLLAASALAGCTGLSARNFEFTAAEIGWNAGERAAFTLTLRPGAFQDDPSYRVDPQFAIERLHFERRGLSFRGDHTTRNAADLDLVLKVDGVRVERATLTADAPSVTVEMVVPTDLWDDVYVLELTLFEVGVVKSNAFRVNRP